MSPDSFPLPLARSWCLHILHDGVIRCPECGNREFSAAQRDSFETDGRVHCRCGKWFRNRTGTILEKSVLDWRQVAMVLHFLGTGTPLLDLAGAARCRVDDVVRLQHWMMHQQRLY